MISIIAAQDLNRAIGKGNIIPWTCPADLKYFKEKTLNKPIIMGRKTFESLPSLLSNRLHIVLTENKGYEAPKEVRVTHSFEKAIEIAEEWCPECDEIMVIGGHQIYELALPVADKIYLTTIHTEIEDPDAYFPSNFNMELTSYSHHFADDKNPQPYTFAIYQ